MSDAGKVAGEHATAPHVVGELATCPACGREVFQKQMIPVLGATSEERGAEGSVGPLHSYLCVDCARERIDTAQVNEPQGVRAASDEPGEATGA